MKCRAWIIFLAILTSLPGTTSAATVGTSFTYQGHLMDGANPAEGLYDLQFALYDSDSGENAVGTPVTCSEVAVSNGLFTVALDFGAVFDGTARWLDIGVRATGQTPFTVLTPRQALTPAPYAVTAGNLSGPLPAEQLTGTMADSRLSANVALLNSSHQIFSGRNFFTGQVWIGGTSGYALEVSGGIAGGILYDRDDSMFYIDPASVSMCNDIRASIFRDRDDPTYYVDPATTSMCNDFRASTFYDRNNTAFYLRPASVSYLNDVRADIVYDRNDLNYYLDPAGTSRLLALDSDSVKTKILYDRDNTGFFMDPASTSICNDVRVNILYDLNDSTYYVDPATISRFNEVRAGKFCAKADPSYFLDPAGTNKIFRLEVTGPAQLSGLVRSGTETGTSESPSPAGLVVRRINSINTGAGLIVARTDTVTLERDGTSGGFVIRYPASPGYLTIALMGMDSAGTQRNFYTTLANPGSAGTVQVCTEAQHVVHFECTFGITYTAGQHLTQVTLSRYGSDFYWSGTVTSTYNQ